MGLVVASCGHRFSKVDISEWIKKKIDKAETPTCPVCIKKINKKLISINLSNDTNSDPSSLKNKSVSEKINGGLSERGALNLALRISGNISAQNKPAEQDVVAKDEPKKTIDPTKMGGLQKRL